MLRLRSVFAVAAKIRTVGSGSGGVLSLPA